MFPILVALLLNLAPQTQVATHAALLEEMQQTLHYVYNMEFRDALQAAQAIIDRAPEHPAGYFYRAVTYWQWRTVEMDERQREALLRDFDQLSQQALQLAARLPPEQAAEAAFYRGAMHGIRARMHFVQKRYRKAIYDAKWGGVYLQQCVAEDPTWYDAYVGLGTYHYILSRIPGFWRGVVQEVIGIEGDRKRGLQELEQARQQGQLASSEATSILAKIYTLSSERRYRQATVLLEELIQRYPNNFDYRYRLAYLSARMGRWKRAQELLQGLIDMIEQGHPYYSRQWLPTLHYREAELAVLQGDHQTAMALLHTLQQQKLDNSLHTWVMLRLANAQDLQGARQEARALYKQVRRARKEKHARKLARGYLDKPFRPGRARLKKPEETI